jgi:hypothetical protein
MMSEIETHPSLTEPISLTWRPDAAQVVERHKAWFLGKTKYLITLTPKNWNSFNWDLSIDVPAKKPIETYDFDDDEQLSDFLDFRLDQYIKYWTTKLEWKIDDDFIPVFEPRIGWAEVVTPFYDPLIVQFYAQTSQILPVINDYNSFDWGSFGFNPERKGSRLLMKINQWSSRQSKNAFIVQPRGLDANPSDVAKAYRGSQLFIDFKDDPVNVHHLMELATQAVIDLIEYQRSVLGGKVLGGYGTTWHGGYWTPNNVIGHLGDNVSDLVSGRTFEEFILPYLQRFNSHFGGCVFARDFTSRQIWNKLRKMGNVLAFKPRNMGAYKITIEDIRSIAESTEGLPLFLQAFSFEELCQFAKIVKELDIRAFFVFDCQDKKEGERGVELIHNLG